MEEMIDSLYLKMKATPPLNTCFLSSTISCVVPGRSLLMLFTATDRLCFCNVMTLQLGE